MNFCEKLSKIDNISPSCNLTDGLENIGYIISRSDVDYAQIKYGYTSGSVELPKTVVTQLAAKDGKKGYFVGQLKNAFSGTNVALATGDYKNTFTNTVSFTVFANDPKTAATINGLANGEYVMILEQKQKGEDGESSFRIFGLDNGLVASEITNDPYSDTIGNAWNVTLTEEKAASSEYFLFVSNGSDAPTAEATRACLNAMFAQPE